MPGIFTALITASGALTAFDRGLSTAQNNVANSSTPGFARQRLSLGPLPFDAEGGLPGGVVVRGLESSRNAYSEMAVRKELHDWGYTDQLASGLSGIEPLFEATGQSGIPGAISSFLQSFAALSVAPNDGAARRVVLDRAEDVAARFRETASALALRQTDTEAGLRSAVGSINRIAGALRDWNVHVRASSLAADDPNIDAALYSTLEELAEYVDFTMIRHEDGSASVLLDGGQAPLVLGDQAFELQLDLTATSAAIRHESGQDVTAQITSGRLAGFLELRETAVPTYMAGLDQLAAAFADRVNTVLAAGVDMNGDAGAPMFTYDAVAGAARSIAATALDVSEIAAASAASPGGNANALTLAALVNSPEIGGLSFTEYYGTLSARAGRDLSGARERAEQRSLTLMQARTLRDQDSAVSLDEEALRILEFQRAYEAAARLVTVLDELTQTTINMLQR